MKTVDEICDELDTVICEELNVVSYKWLARHYELPANYAKQVLFKFSESRGGNVKTTFLLAGYSQPKDGETGSQHLMLKLVDGSSLDTARREFSQITSMHVHSVAPSTQIDDDNYWQADYKQVQAIVDSITQPTYKGQKDLMQHNLLSAVKFQTEIVPSGIPVKGSGAAQTSPTTKPAAVPVNKISAAPRGTTSVLQAVSVNQAAADGAGNSGSAVPDEAKGPTEAATTEAGNRAGGSPSENNTTTAPVAARTSSGVAVKAPGKAGGNSLARMWSKVPAKQASAAVKASVQAAAAEPSEEREQDVPPAPQATGKRSAEPEVIGKNTDKAQDEGAAADEEGDEEEEDVVRRGRSSGRRQKRRVVHEEEEEEEDVADASPAAASPPGEDDAVIDVDADDEKAPASKATARKSGKGSGAGRKRQPSAASEPKSKKPRGKGKASAPEEQPDSTPADEANLPSAPASKTNGKPQQPPVEPAGAGSKPAAPSAFKSTTAASAGATYKKKTTRTYYNERGEEITEEVFEEVPVSGDMNNGGQANGAGVGQGDDAVGDKDHGKEGQQNGAAAPAAEVGKKSEGGKGGGNQKQAGGKASKPSKAAAGTRNIMSFFAKKS